MDTTDLRILVTLLGLCSFIALVIWAWRPALQARHQAAAQLPFADDTWFDDDGVAAPSFNSQTTRKAGPHE
jgi:cbb3-type cytochrome oxidase subunit 3